MSRSDDKRQSGPAEAERAALRDEAHALVSDPADREEARRVLDEMDVDFGRLRANPEDAARFDVETALWDTTSADGAAPDYGATADPPG